MRPFPISETSPVEHAAPLPGKADAVVIGGGVIGASAALFLARRGQRVVLLEKGRIAGEQSSRNWGWVRVQGRDPAEVPVMLEARRHWQDFVPQLDTDIGLRQTGLLYLAETQDDLARYEGWMPHARAFGLDTRLVAPRDLAELLPGASGRWMGGLWTPSDMRAEPFLAVPALARLAAREGAVVAESCAVRLLDIEAGKVMGVITERGRIRAPAVILAAGAWSSLFLRRHGLSIPQLSVRATVARTTPLPEVFGGGAVDSRLAFRRRLDGGYTLAPDSFHELLIGPDAFRALGWYLPQLRSDPLGTTFRPAAPRGYPDAWTTPRRWAGDTVSPFERMRVLNPEPNRNRVKRLARRMRESFPALGPVGIEQAWAGMIDTMPDTLPVVDRAAALPGLTIATGMSGHGFGIGPAFGRIAADLALGAEPGHDLTRFRLARFHGGSPLVPAADL